MNKNSRLFDLIKSLTKSEKRYFKLYVSQYNKEGKNLYIQLFEAIEKQKSFDDKILKRNSLNPQKFISEKKYLYKLILNTLHGFHAGSSAGDELNRTLHHAEILLQKKLFSQAGYLLEKAKTAAREREKFSHLLEIFRMERKLYSEYAGFKQREKIYISTLQEERNVLGKLQNLEVYTSLYTRLILLYNRIGTVRSPEDLREVNNIKRNSLFGNIHNATSNSSKVFYYYMKYTMYEIEGKHEDGYRYRKALVDFLEKQPQFLQENFKTYLNGIYNLLIGQSFTGKYEDYRLTMEKFKKLDLSHRKYITPLLRQAKLLQTYLMETSVFIRTAHFEKILAMVPDIKPLVFKESGKDGADLIKIMILCNNLAIAYLTMGKLKNALDWVNININRPDTGLRDDIQSITRLLGIIIHYELRNTEFLESYIRSTYRFLKKKNRLHKFEMLLLSFIRKRINRITSPKSFKKSLAEFRKQCITIFKDPLEEKILNDFDFISWLESKIEQKPFAEILLKKAVINS